MRDPSAIEGVQLVTHGNAAGSTQISQVSADQVVVRGLDLCRDLIGKRSFTSFFYLLVTGEEPTPALLVLLDAVLIAIAEHGLVPSVVASRMTYAADPEALQGAVAAGLLGCGSVVLGTAEAAGRLIDAGLRESGRSGAAVAEVATRVVNEHLRAKRRLPGFGHPIHRPVDPRAIRLLELADEQSTAGRAVAYARALDAAVRAVSPKPLPMNVSLAIPAVMLDVGFPLAVMKGIPLLARTASLIAHLAEENRAPIGMLLGASAERAIAFAGKRP
jgi:citrate synthase